MARTNYLKSDAYKLQPLQSVLKKEKLVKDGIFQTEFAMETFVQDVRNSVEASMTEDYIAEKILKDCLNGNIHAPHRPKQSWMISRRFPFYGALIALGFEVNHVVSKRTGRCVATIIS